MHYSQKPSETLLWMYRACPGFVLLVWFKRVLAQMLMFAMKGTFLLKTLYWGHQGARDNFALQIRNIVEAGFRSLGERPVIIGECGIPMDMK